MMEQVTAWKSEDGEVWRTEDGALKRDAKIGLEEWAARRGIGRGGEWSSDMILSAMLEDAEELVDLLAAYSGHLPDSQSGFVSVEGQLAIEAGKGKQFFEALAADERKADAQ